MNYYRDILLKKAAMKLKFRFVILLPVVLALLEVSVGSFTKADLRDLYDETNCNWRKSQWRSLDDDSVRYCRNGKDIYETYEDGAKRVGKIRVILKSQTDRGRNTDITESQLEVEGGKLVKYTCKYKLGLSCESPTREILGVTY